jgi:Domain of unknown function (DUF4112)
MSDHREQSRRFCLTYSFLRKFLGQAVLHPKSSGDFRLRIEEKGVQSKIEDRQSKVPEWEVLPPEDRSRSQQTSASLESLFRWLALIMDDFLRVPGTKRRFGLDPIIGLLPGIGDIASAIVSAVAFVHAARCGVPKILLARMAMNILINELVGIIPGSSRTCATTNCSAGTLPRPRAREEATGYSSSQFSACCLSLCARD